MKEMPQGYERGCEWGAGVPPQLQGPGESPSHRPERQGPRAEEEAVNEDAGRVSNGGCEVVGPCGVRFGEQQGQCGRGGGEHRVEVGEVGRAGGQRHSPSEGTGLVSVGGQGTEAACSCPCLSSWDF